MPGWGKPLYEMKEAEIPKGDVPSAFDWRDKGTCNSSIILKHFYTKYVYGRHRDVDRPL